MSFSNYKIKEVAQSLSRDLRRKQTPAEKIFWERVRGRKFKDLKFYRQFSLYYDYLGIETFYIADFYCHSEKLVIELDGTIHKYKKKQDALRAEIINLLGIRILRFKNDDVLNDTSNVFKKIEEIIDKN
ncbi:MAG: endonuclease domain-containing protein [Ignavibacteriaceae bacterium]